MSPEATSAPVASTMTTEPLARMTATQTCRLFDLPYELASQIVSELGYHDAVSFRLVCKAAAYELIPFQAVLLPKRTALKTALSAWELSDERLRQENWHNAHRWSLTFPETAQAGGPHEGINNLHENRITRVDELNCYSCLRTLPRSEFHVGQTKGQRSLGHGEHTKRFCIDCGWRKKIWAPGNVSGRGAKCVLICRYCGDLNRSPDPLFRTNRICGMRCWPKVVRLWVPHGELRKQYDEKCEVAGFSVSGAWRNSGMGLTSSRHVKCMRCWTNDHTERPRWSTESDFCLDCQVQLGVEGLKLDDTTSKTKGEGEM